MVEINPCFVTPPSHPWPTRIGLLLLGIGLIYTLASLLLYGSETPWQASGFPLLRGFRMPTFADLRWVTATSSCGVDLDALYKLQVVGCDAYGRVGKGSYPPMSIWVFRLLGIQAAWTNLLGLVSGLLLLSTSGWILIKTARNKSITVTVAACLIWGYPLQLALERMNIDVLVFLLIALHCYLLSFRDSRWTIMASLPLSIVNVGMKIYPLFAYFGLLLLSRPIAALKNKAISLSRTQGLVILLGSCIGLITAAPILMGDGNVVVAEGGLGSHGLKAFGFINMDLIKLTNLPISRLLIRMLFALKLGSLIAGFSLTIQNHLADALSRALNSQSKRQLQNQLTYTLITMTSTWLGCYLINISYDYRLIFMIPFVAILAQSTSLMESASQRIWGYTVCLATLLPGLTTSLYVAIPIGDRFAKVGHEVLVEFVLLPLVAGSAAGLLIQLLGLPSRLRLRPAASPAPPQVLRDPCR